MGDHVFSVPGALVLGYGKRGVCQLGPVVVVPVSWAGARPWLETGALLVGVLAAGGVVLSLMLFAFVSWDGYAERRQLRRLSVEELQPRGRWGG